METYWADAQEMHLVSLSVIGHREKRGQIMRVYKAIFSPVGHDCPERHDSPQPTHKGMPSWLMATDPGETKVVISAPAARV